MADCYGPEADDLHLRWLPREIFADIGIVDPDLAVVNADAAPPAAPAVEELAAQLAGILGTGGEGDPARKSAPPPATLAPVAATICHRAPVCGLEGPAFVTLGGGGGGNVVGRGAAVPWPVTPYSPVQWQVAGSFVNALDYPRLPPPACRVPGATSRPRGGTGVFLPRADAYRHAPPPPAKDAKAPAGPRTGGRPAAQQQRQRKEQAAAAGRRAAAHGGRSSCSEAAAALPQEWSYQ